MTRSLGRVEWTFPFANGAWVWIRIIAGVLTLGYAAVLFLTRRDPLGALETPAAGAAAGLVVFAGSWALAAAAAELCEDWRLRKMRGMRLRRRRESVMIREARIVSDFVPLVDGLPEGARRGGLLRIVGYGGGYILGKKGKFLRDSLARWTRDGLSVEYILMNPDPGVRETYRDFVSQMEEEARSRLRILCPRDGAPIRRDGNREFDTGTFERLHPTLFRGVRGPEDGDGEVAKAMWIEGVHEPGSDIAYDVTWTPPEAMGAGEEELYARYDRAIGALKRRCEPA